MDGDASACIVFGSKGSENPERLAWLFSLEAATRNGARQLKQMYDFNWRPREITGGAEESFKDVPDLAPGIERWE